MGTDAENDLRNLILRKLEALEAGQNELRADVVAIKVQLNEFNAIKQQVDGLRLWKAQIVGVVFAINALAVLIGWYVKH